MQIILISDEINFSLQFMNYIESLISFLIIVPFLVQPLNVNIQNAQLAIKSNTNTNNIEIFGVRWRLGDAFNLQQIQSNDQQYVLQFDSKTPINAQTYVQFKNQVFSCSEQEYTSQIFSTYVHTCRINEAPLFPYEYHIVKKEVYLNGKDDSIQVKQLLQTILFTGKLEISNIGESILVLGDIYHEENGSFLCPISNIIQKQKNSVVIIGDLYPQINQENYFQILTFLQPATSRAIVISIHHPQAQSQVYYQLAFPFSLTSQEKQFKAFKFNKWNYTIFHLNPKLANTNLYIQTLTNNPQLDLKQELFIILSPFQQNQYSNFYSQINKNIQLSTENNKGYSILQQCSKGKQDQNEKKCSYKIKQGKTIFISKQQDYGIMKIIDHSNFKTFTFDHFSKCEKKDHMEVDYSFVNQQTSTGQDSNKNDTTEIFQKIIIAMEYILIISLLAFMLITFITLRKKSSAQKESQQKHVQLVEQIVAGSHPQN